MRSWPKGPCPLINIEHEKLLACTARKSTCPMQLNKQYHDFVPISF